MSQKRIETLSDLTRHKRSLSVECRACGHQSALSPVKLMFLDLPGNTPIEELFKRFRCSKCGAKDVVAYPPSR